MVETVTLTELQRPVNKTSNQKQLNQNQTFISIMEKNKNEFKNSEYQNDNTITEALLMMLLNENLINIPSETLIGQNQIKEIVNEVSNIYVETDKKEINVNSDLKKDKLINLIKNNHENNKDIITEFNVKNLNQIINKIVTKKIVPKEMKETSEIQYDPKTVKKQIAKNVQFLKDQTQKNHEKLKTVNIQGDKSDIKSVFVKQNKTYDKVQNKFLDLEHDKSAVDKKGEYFKPPVIIKTAVDKGKDVYEFGKVLEAKGLETINKNLLVETAEDSINPLQTDKKPVIEQIVKKISLNLQEERTEMKIQLEPESLGKMVIKLVINKGLLNAKISVDNHQIKNVILNHVSDIKEIFQNQGYDVQGFSVFVGEEKMHQFQQRQNKPAIKLKKIKTDEEKKSNIKCFSDNLRTEFLRSDMLFNYLI